MVSGVLLNEQFLIHRRPLMLPEIPNYVCLKSLSSKKNSVYTLDLKHGSRITITHDELIGLA